MLRTFHINDIVSIKETEIPDTCMLQVYDKLIKLTKKDIADLHAITSPCGMYGETTDFLSIA
jgi:hypothetical protein